MGVVLSITAACASSTNASTGSPTPTSSSQPSASAAPVSYDPCVLVNVHEASMLTGINYGAGREELANATKLCWYGYQTADVFEIGIVQAPDLATVQADEVQAKAALQKAASNGLVFTDVQGVGDAAAEVQATRSANGTTLNLCGIYVVKGTIFFFITDVAVNHAVPGNAALQGEAMVVLGRL
jgi:hypothetical protein